MNILYIYTSKHNILTVYSSRDHILGDFRVLSDDPQHIKYPENIYRELSHIIFHTFFSHEELELWDIVHVIPVVEEGIIQFFAVKSLEKTAIWQLSRVHQELIGWFNDYQNYILGTQYDVPICPESNWSDFPNDDINSYYGYGIKNIIWYEKVPLVFWLLNEKIKDVTGEQKNLADVWKYFHDNDPGTIDTPTTFNEILIACNNISGHDFTTFFNYYVTGNNELPYYNENNMLLIDESSLPPIPPLS